MISNNSFHHLLNNLGNSHYFNSESDSSFDSEKENQPISNISHIGSLINPIDLVEKDTVHSYQKQTTQPKTICDDTAFSLIILGQKPLAITSSTTLKSYQTDMFAQTSTSLEQPIKKKRKYVLSNKKRNDGFVEQLEQCTRCIEEKIMTTLKKHINEFSENFKKQLKQDGYEIQETRQWRKGPDGIRLCNACGIKYKSSKKKEVEGRPHKVQKIRDLLNTEGSSLFELFSNFKALPEINKKQKK